MMVTSLICQVNLITLPPEGGGVLGFCAIAVLPREGGNVLKVDLN